VRDLPGPGNGLKTLDLDRRRPMHLTADHFAGGDSRSESHPFPGGRSASVDSLARVGRPRSGVIKSPRHNKLFSSPINALALPGPAPYVVARGYEYFTRDPRYTTIIRSRPGWWRGRSHRAGLSASFDAFWNTASMPTRSPRWPPR